MIDDESEKLPEYDYQNNEYGEIQNALKSLQNEYEKDILSEEQHAPMESVGSSLEDADENLSDSDQPLDIQTLLQQTTYVGNTPYATIIESITSQFEDYIGMDDSNDYVDIFYDQLMDSFEEIEDQDEYHDEKREILYELQDKFISFMCDEFETRLGITITTVDSEETDYELVEEIIRVLYDYFILNARKNFQVVLAKDMVPNIVASPDDDVEYLKEVQQRIMGYSPIIMTITPDRFLELSDGADIKNLYDSGMVVGNFLRKYSLKLYQYPEYEVELINFIMMYDSSDGSN